MVGLSSKAGGKGLGLIYSSDRRMGLSKLGWAWDLWFGFIVWFRCRVVEEVSFLLPLLLPGSIPLTMLGIGT